MHFDYVVVGGGSAGCCLAGRLSEDPKTLQQPEGDIAWPIPCPARRISANWVLDSIQLV
jgi:hypothetical protein